MYKVKIYSKSVSLFDAIDYKIRSFIRISIYAIL